MLFIASFVCFIRSVWPVGWILISGLHGATFYQLILYTFLTFVCVCVCVCIWMEQFHWNWGKHTIFHLIKIGSIFFTLPINLMFDVLWVRKCFGYNRSNTRSHSSWLIDILTRAMHLNFIEICTMRKIWVRCSPGFSISKLYIRLTFFLLLLSHAIYICEYFSLFFGYHHFACLLFESYRINTCLCKGPELNMVRQTLLANRWNEEIPKKKQKNWLHQTDMQFNLKWQQQIVWLMHASFYFY